MAQHDYVIANGTGAAVRSDLNNALAAIVSQNSGATAPSPTYAYQFWADTTTGLLKLRNSANSAWITLFQLDGEWSTLPVENGTAAAPSIYFKDSGTDTGFYSGGIDQVGISTGGTARLTIDANGNVAVDTNTLYVDAPNNRVGIGTNSPDDPLHVVGRIKNVVNATYNITASYGFAFRNATTTAKMLWGGYDNTADVGFIQATHEGVAHKNLLINPNGGNVGIGTQSPQELLDLYGTGNTTFRISGSSGGGGDVSQIDFFRIGSNVTSSIKAVRDGGNTSGALTFLTASSGTNSERARLTASGQLLVGTSSSPSSGNGQYSPLVIQGYIGGSTGEGGISIQRGQAASSIVADTAIGVINFNDNAGNTFANIIARGDATAGTNDYPGRLVFSTTADGASSPTERMRITNSGAIIYGKTTLLRNTLGAFFDNGIGSNYFILSITSGATRVLDINRQTDDGNLVEFYQADTLEGSISVSGTTVSYNGAHLSRWSQLPSGQERTEILRGTVLSNIDEMCEWGDEENEQLNRMKVSDVEGDKNVSGVFQAWDDDDDTYTNDFYCAMTGDFIIRIGAGVTVERGDLLMSAGDGTAKPQADDLVRSCTIAKVTSTNVSCTYDDGSYCVPCVLMAC